MTIRPSDVRHVAHLARLAVDDDHIESLSGELDAIIGHMEVLGGVDTTGVPPVTGVGAGGTPLRPDSGPPIPLALPIEAFAPETRDGFFIVPRLATHEDEEDRSP